VLKKNSSFKYEKEYITDDLEKIKNIKKDLIDKNKNKDVKYSIYSTNVEKYEVKIVDNIKPKNEWTLLGTIDHKEQIVKAAPNQHIPTELIPSDLSSCNCDHCNIDRTRNKTVFIKNNNTNEIIRVGGSCIKYYLGYDYKKVLDYLSELNLFIENYSNSDDKKSYDFYGVRYNPMNDTISTKIVIKYFFMYLKNHKFLTKTGAEKINSTKVEGDKFIKSTAIEVQSELDYILEDPADKRWYTTSQEEKEWQEQEIKDWMKACEEFYKDVENESDIKYEEFVKYVEDNYKDNNFLFNVQNMIKNNNVPKHQINYVLSACSMYQGKIEYENYKKLSDEERQRKREKEKNESNWVGTVGSTMKLENLKIVNISGFDGKYGWTNVYKLKDEKGNNFTKFGTINPKFLVDGKENVEVDSVVSFVAEITKHDTYNDIKQTTIGRLSKI
jgi:hypothetical protein